MIKALANVIILLIQFPATSVIKHFLRFEENSLEKRNLPILNLEGGDYRRNFASQSSGSDLTKFALSEVQPQDIETL